MSVSGSARRDRWTRFIPVGYSGVLALLIAGPLLGPGYLLLRDAVSTPRSYPTDSALGLGDAAPRAVPQDALLAALSPIIDGGLIVKTILLVALWAAGYGAAVLVRELLRVSLGPQLVAVTVALWNPYVAERLLQGHWSLLTGYAALPWTALAAYRIRASAIAHRATRPDAPRRATRPNAHSAAGSWAALAGCFAAAGLTPTGALLAGCTALVLVGWRNLLGTLALLLAASAPWLTATALSGAGSEPSDPTGIAAFAARAEPSLGTLGSLAGLGGIWNADSVPDSRTTLLALIGTGLLLVLVATGIRAGSTAVDTDRAGRTVRRALLVLAAVAVALPALGATPWGMNAMEWLVARVPGAGLLRDTQKYVALAVPAYALCAAAGCRALARRFTVSVVAMDQVAGEQGVTGQVTAIQRTTAAGADRPAADQVTANEAGADQTGADEAGRQPDSPGKDESPSAATTSQTDSAEESQPRTAVMTMTATAFIVLLVLPLFDLAWGVGGQLRPVHYPIGWQRVAERIDGPGDIAVLPGGMFRKFPYSGRAPVLDPAPRILPGDVLQTGELPVHGRTVAGEGARARDVEELLLHGGSVARLAGLGVGWVVVERTTPGPLGDSKMTLAQLEPIYTDAQLELYHVPGTTDRSHESQTAHRLLAYAAHILWAAMLLGGLLVAAILRQPRRPVE